MQNAIGAGKQEDRGNVGQTRRRPPEGESDPVEPLGNEAWHDLRGQAIKSFGPFRPE